MDPYLELRVSIDEDLFMFSRTALEDQLNRSGLPGAEREVFRPYTLRSQRNQSSEAQASRMDDSGIGTSAGEESEDSEDGTACEDSEDDEIIFNFRRHPDDPPIPQTDRLVKDFLCNSNEDPGTLSCVYMGRGSFGLSAKVLKNDCCIKLMVNTQLPYDKI